MEPTNIDKQFREGLKNQEIQPSAAAWDRLDPMLSIAEKPKQSYNWMYVAASFLGFMIISSVLYFQSEPLIDKNNNLEVVKTNIDIAPIHNKSKIEKTEVAIITKKVSNQNPKTEKSVAATKKTIKQKTGVQSSSELINQNKTQEIAIAPNKAEKTGNVVLEKPQQPKYIDATALLADIENKNTSSKTIVNIPKATYKMEAKVLLSQVDGELEQNFRENVFQKIKKNYQNIKVAVSERNNKQ